MNRITAAALSTIMILCASITRAEDVKIRVEFDTPATNYRVAIQEVYQVGKELWVVSNVFTEGDFGGAAITPVSDEITVDAPQGLEVVHKVLGKSWNWGKDTKSLQYVKSAKELEKKLKAEMATRIWQREKPKSKSND